MTTLIKTATGLVLAATMFVPFAGSSAQDEAKGEVLPKEITWKLGALDREPTHVVRTHYDAKRGLALWILELVRDLDVYEDGAYWRPAYELGRRSRFRFELHDADGIVLKTIDGRYLGEYVNKGGKRFGVILDLPPDLVRFTKTVEVVVD